MGARGSRTSGSLAFAVLTAVAVVVGRDLTARIDRALHVRPLAPSGAGYYPFLLAGIRVVAALALAALLARFLRARSTAGAAHRLLDALGHRHGRRSPRLRPSVPPRVWAAAFAVEAIAYLVRSDALSPAHGTRAPFSPWLHTFALPVLALLAVVVALVWSLCRWVREVEEYAVRALARVRRILTAAFSGGRARRRPGADRAPRRRFGIAFESRPPPLGA